MKFQTRKRLKRAAALLLSVVLVAGTSTTVFAQENDTEHGSAHEGSSETEAVTDGNQPEEPGTAPDENQPAEPDTTPDENQPAEPGTTPDENQPEEPGTTPDENQPAEPGTTPDGNQPEQPDAKPGENQTEKPGTSPEKEPSKKADEELSKPASRTLSARSGDEDSSDYMWYSNVLPKGTWDDHHYLLVQYRFNINGIDNGNKILTTFANQGYRTAFRVNGRCRELLTPDGVADMGNNLYGKRELSLLNNGKYVMVRYTVENRGDSDQTFDIGSCADVQIGENDKAPVVGTSTGLSMSDGKDNSYKFNLFAPTVTTLWYGYYEDAYENVFTDLPDKTIPTKDVDSGIAWSWTGTVSPGMTWSRYVLIGVGDLPEPPGNPVITTEELKTGLPDELINGTADPNNTVYIEMLGEEYKVIADKNGEFSLPINLPADTREGPTDISYYAISPEGGISDNVRGSIEIIGAPFIRLKETETTVEKDSELNEEWYQSFIESSRGDVIYYDATPVKIDEIGEYVVTYTAQREGFDDCTATLTVKVVHTHDFGTKWESNETSHWHECKCGEKSEVADHSFGEWMADETSHWKECTICGEKSAVAVHSFGEWQSDGTNHWKECECGKKTEVGVHNLGEWMTNETNHWKVCSICNRKTEETAHSFGEWMTDETSHWKECAICGEKSAVAVHSFGEWQSDGTNHWKECECGKKNEVGAHSLSEWMTDETDHWKVCTICNKKTEEAAHNFGEWIIDETNHWKECAICGEKSEEAAHNFGEWVTNKTNHWKECECGKKTEVGAHSLGNWMIDEASHWKECTICNEKMGEAAHNFGEWIIDETSHWKECECGKRTEVGAHIFGKWMTDETIHWKECECGEKIKVGAHNFEKWEFDETNHWKECECGEKAEIAAHSFGEWITDETNHWKECECGKKTEEAAHSFGEWQSDETNHWKECECGEKAEVGAHSFGEWMTDREATATEPGTRHRECSECGYREEGTIPATGRTDSPAEDNEEEESEPEEPETPTDNREGNFAKSVEKLDGVPDVDVATPAAELQSMLLTNAERQQMRNGASIRVVFDVKVAETTVNSTDRTLVESALNESSLSDFTMGQYLDISLYKLIDRTRIDINETPKKITVTIDVPEDLRNTGSARTFAVIRVHNGQTEILNDLDDNDDTITIETDRFSTYAVVYKDSANVNAGGNSYISQNPNTGSNSLLELFMTLAMAAAGGVFLFLYFSGRKKD